jgi:hypothetical protein
MELHDQAEAVAEIVAVIVRGILSTVTARLVVVTGPSLPLRASPQVHPRSSF